MVGRLKGRLAEQLDASKARWAKEELAGWPDSHTDGRTTKKERQFGKREDDWGWMEIGYFSRNDVDSQTAAYKWVILLKT